MLESMQTIADLETLAVYRKNRGSDAAMRYGFVLWFRCNMEEEAALVAYEGVTKNK